MEKSSASVIHDQNLELQERAVLEKSGTSRDAEDMQRLGRVQQLRRNFGFFSIFGFSMIILSTWQVLLSVVAFALPNGGTAGIIYGFIITAFFYNCINASMAEMASIAPTAGGQYHWVSEFAPRSSQKVLSYFIGWLCSLGWQSGCAIGCFLAATQIQGLIVLNMESYVYERWHGTLLTIAILLFVFIFNSFLVHHLPLVETLILILYLCGFVAILVPLWVLGPKTSSRDTWTKFEDLGGWGSAGAATVIGLISPTTTLLGADAAVHMAEELKDASRLLPRVMISTTIINAVLGFVMIITFLYNIGDVEQVLATPTGFPFIQVFYNATGSKGGATAMTLVLTLSSVANAMTNMATASRQLWAFARDGGVPFHPWFAQVNSRLEIPLNAVIFTACFTILLSLINIGSTVAYNQINSLGVGALLASYFISISCITLRRLRKQHLPSSPFKLGQNLGLLTNILSLAFLALAFAISFFPLYANPTYQTMNWASLAFSSVLIIGGVYYWVRARFHYVGPVEYVAKLD